MANILLKSKLTGRRQTRTFIWNGRARENPAPIRTEKPETILRPKSPDHFQPNPRTGTLPRHFIADTLGMLESTLPDNRFNAFPDYVQDPIQAFFSLLVSGLAQGDVDSETFHTVLHRTVSNFRTISEASERSLEWDHVDHLIPEYLDLLMPKWFWSRADYEERAHAEQVDLLDTPWPGVSSRSLVENYPDRRTHLDSEEATLPGHDIRNALLDHARQLPPRAKEGLSIEIGLRNRSYAEIAALLLISSNQEYSGSLFLNDLMRIFSTIAGILDTLSPESLNDQGQASHHGSATILRDHLERFLDFSDRLFPKWFADDIRRTYITFLQTESSSPIDALVIEDRNREGHNRYQGPVVRFGRIDGGKDNRPKPWKDSPQRAQLQHFRDEHNTPDRALDWMARHPEVVSGEFSNDLAQLAGRFQTTPREVLRLQGKQGALVRLENGWSYLNFGANNYLGLAGSKELADAMRRGLDTHGAGAAASQLMTGSFIGQANLEGKFSNFVGSNRSLHFNSGYAANMGAIAALVGKDDLVVADRLSHASIIDGCLLSQAKLRRHLHKDLADLERILERQKTKYRRRLIITEGVFSMDGTIGAIPELLEIANRHDALLYVDDAHGIGVMGPQGQGTSAHFGIDAKDHPNLIQMFTLTKALGSYGAMVSGDESLYHGLTNGARTLMFSSALPPPVFAMTSEALDILQGDGGRLAQLRENSRRFSEGLQRIGIAPLSPHAEMPIQPIVIPDDDRVLDLSRILYESGILASAASPPVVPSGKSRLRFSLAADHTPAQIDYALDILNRHVPISDRL